MLSSQDLGILGTWFPPFLLASLQFPSQALLAYPFYIEVPQDPRWNYFLILYSLWYHPQTYFLWPSTYLWLPNSSTKRVLIVPNSIFNSLMNSDLEYSTGTISSTYLKHEIFNPNHAAGLKFPISVNCQNQRSGHQPQKHIHVYKRIFMYIKCVCLCMCNYILYHSTLTSPLLFPQILWFLFP